MSGLYVLEPGRGIGTKMVRERERIARELGCTRTRASVFRNNEPAKRFVSSRGLDLVRGYREPTFGVMVDHYEGSLH